MANDTGPLVAVLPLLSQDETVALLLERSKRPKQAVPIRRDFLQQGAQRKPRPGPLATLVTRGDDRALELYLLLHAVASGGDFDVTEWSNTWGRAIGITQEAGARTAVSRAWRRLENLNLISRERGAGGRTKVILRREDGTGAPYDHPNARREPYLQLPYEYWTAERRWYRTLPFAAKAVLVIALSLTSRVFWLPHDRAGRWYGISGDTIGRGLQALENAGLVEPAGTDFVPNLQSKTGYLVKQLYTLMPPFDLDRRGMGRKKPVEPAEPPLSWAAEEVPF